MDTSQIQRPRAVDTVEYVRARVEQIAELLEMVDNPALGLGEVTSGPRTVFQRLPRHMRRRAMSHNVKRLPRALRQIAARHTLRTAHRKRAPSRKWRRRPTRMLKRWVRAQRKGVWLETHIWHAKRFHMADLWGYKLPMRSCQRGFRPNYRCSVHSAITIDQSYLCCLQFTVSGSMATDRKVKMLSDSLSQFCHKKVSPTFAHCGAIAGHQEVPLMLFSPGKYPNGFLGPGRVAWTIDGRLLLWMHPSVELQLLAEMEKIPQISIVPSAQIKQMNTAEDNAKFADGDNQNGEQIGRIELVNLRDRLCRLHLIGPKSIEFLRKVIRLSDDEESNDGSYFTQFREMHRWWRTLPSDVLPGNLRDGQIAALLVEDPRLFRAAPLQRQQYDRHHSDYSSTSDDHYSALGHPPLHSPALPPRPPTSLFADWQFFHHKLLPKRLSHGEFESFCADKLARPKRTNFKIPILLVFRRVTVPSPSSVKTIELHCVDLICPSGVGYDFWLALQFAGFRAIGIRDKRALDFEAGIGTFPDDFVDSCAGKRTAETEAKNLKEKYDRKPHNRRVPFGDAPMSVAHPFNFEWEQLLAQWGYNSGDTRQKSGNAKDSFPFFVLRDRQALKRLDLWFRRRPNTISTNGTMPIRPPPPILEDTFASSPNSSSVLVPVFLRMMRRGVPKRLALISLPTDQDLQMLRGGSGDNIKIIIKETETCNAEGEKRTKNESVGEEDANICGIDGEQMTTNASSTPSAAARHIPEFLPLIQPEEQQQQRRNIAHFFQTDETCEQQQLLSLEAMFPDGADDKDRRRKARNVRKRAQKRAKMVSDMTKADEAGLREGEQPMEIEEERQMECIIRKLVGRVVRGDYAFGSAQGMALGFVPLNALEAIAGTNGIVLVRNTTSKYYHPAKMHIHLTEQTGI